MNIASDPKKGILQFEGVAQEILQETSPVLTPEEREQIRKVRENEGMLEFYGGGRLNDMVSYLKTNSINKIRAREIYLDLEVDQILPMEGQPRKYFDREALDDLKASIDEKGLSNPILVRRSGERFQIIAGERRWRAFKELGRSKIPAIIKEVKDDKEAYILSAIENLQREDLNVIEEALCYQKMLDTGAVASQKELALIVGRNKSKISERLSLLKLPERVKEFLCQKDAPVSEGHAIELLRLKDGKRIQDMAERIVAEKLSRDDLRREINQLLGRDKAGAEDVADAAEKGGDLIALVPPQDDGPTHVAPETVIRLEPLPPPMTLRPTTVAAMQPALAAEEPFTIRYTPISLYGFDLAYRFRPELNDERDLKTIIDDLGRRAKMFKRLRKELRKKGIFNT